MGAAASRPLPSTSARGGRSGVTPTTDEPAAGPGTAEPETAEPEPAAGPEIPEPAPPSPGTTLWLSLLRVVGALAIPIAGFFALWKTFDFLRDTEANRSLVVLVAVVVGVGGIFFLFWAMNRLVSYLPARFREGVRPYIFVGPCLVILSVFLIYPVINTIIVSFKDATSSKFVGFDNFKFVFTDKGMLTAIRNTAGWIILVPLVATAIGLGFATLADRLRRGEAVAKSLIFLPMAISFAGASIVWNFIYSFRPQGFGTNIGLLNGIMVWMQTGFAMVVLSAAIKAVPDEIIEAARIDGASELQVFRRIIVPTILPTIVVVGTYMVINAMKVFDIVFVMGNAEGRGTEVVAERMIAWFFVRGDFGKGAAVAVVLFVAIIPVMIYNIRRFREQETIRGGGPGGQRPRGAKRSGSGRCIPPGRRGPPKAVGGGCTGGPGGQRPRGAKRSGSGRCIPPGRRGLPKAVGGGCTGGPGGQRPRGAKRSGSGRCIP